ncbi:SET domain-containing protein [Massarina eburnea CBS 473.64]|uniref:SET domain-containing protein n=1 Tax=Massarina eburnea CBS 473.64 TaxID=1395130 RepID=A0A6A6S8N2_9PLEO|nr:SET domain-containing protein [Massarina eburnea CBS 473.64]
MIRRGRAEGWLREPIHRFPTWATFNGIKSNGVSIGPLPRFEHRGSTIIADRELEGAKGGPLLLVPRELIVSRQNIDVVAKSDQHLREVLHALGDFGRTTRGAVLIFLLMQATLCCPDIKDIGVHNPLTEYIKFLPDELLPTFWSEEERDLLTGTTLQPAVRAKLNSLLREFEAVRVATAGISWCAKYWWDEDDGLLAFDDWLRLDAMYRSRALEFPNVGDAMVPGIDMANHASGDATAALYDTDESGNGVLVLRDGKEIREGGEVTITYGDEKGACENIFSYGFIEDGMSSAQIMLLDINIPHDDPLRPAKLYVNTTAPGFRVFEKEGGIQWESDFVWLVVVNEEDGLDFKVKQTVDGNKEIQSFWKEQELNDTLKLRGLLKEDPLWEVFQLRAVVLMQNRVDEQIETLRAVGRPERTDTVREGPWKLAAQLCALELDLLHGARSALESEKATLLETETVQRYLGLVEDGDEDVEEADFT